MCENSVEVHVGVKGSQHLFLSGSAIKEIYRGAGNVTISVFTYFPRQEWGDKHVLVKEYSALDTTAALHAGSDSFGYFTHE